MTALGALVASFVLVSGALAAFRGMKASARG